MQPKFCSSCGTPLHVRDIDGSPRIACPSCTFVHWGNYSIGVGALIERDGRYLLVRRAQEPGKGNWTNPGGYIEQHEKIQDTIRREVFEEAGVDAVPTRIIALRDQPRGIHNIYIAFAMDYVSGEPEPDGVEVDAAGFYSIEEMQDMKVASFTRWLLHAAEHGKVQGLTVDAQPIISTDGIGLFRALS